jgi:hypothetical protein
MTSNNVPHPKIDLTTFFLSIASAAYMGVESNLEITKQNIDLLELMQEKTKGNRTTEEDRLVDQLLFELRLHFVEKSKSQKK